MNPTRVAVIGAGTMGHGIAYVAALAGCKVRLTDAQSDALPLAMGKIESLLEGGVRRGKITEQERNQVHERLRAEPHPFLTVGRHVCIKSGPFSGLEGILLRRKGGHRVVVSLEMIQRSISVEADLADVEPKLAPTRVCIGSR